MPKGDTTRRMRARKKPRRKTWRKRDYESNDGMVTAIWGPPLWHVLHTISFNYPVHPTSSERRAYRSFMLSLGCVLPCGHCRRNFKDNIRKFPLTTANLKNRATFSRWMYNFHKCVNGLLGKKTKLSYTAVRDRYENFRSRCTRPTRRRRSGRKKERGCTRPISGVRKSRCILQIVPRGGGQRTLYVDKACVKSS